MWKWLKSILLKHIRCITSMEESQNFWILKNKYTNSKSKIAKFIFLYRYNRLLNKYIAFIPPTCNIEGEPVFPHGLAGIFISSGATIGKDCTIFQHVTIGSNTLQDSSNKGAPTIGDNVYIGAGAKIIGNVTVGNNCRIGANCVVVRDVPSNCTVVGGVSRVIEHNDLINNEFIGFQ